MMSNRNREDRFFRQSNGLKVIRGMVFRYDINPSIRKDSEPMVWVGGNQLRDHRQYGERDWLVVSNDLGNLTSPTCIVVPITSKKYDKSYIPTHVPFYFDGIPLTVLCEHTMTVNTCELREFRYVLQDSIMDKVSEALRVQFQIPENKNSLGITGTLKSIEEMIDSIVQEKVKKYRVNTAKQVDIEDAALRIGEAIESLLKSDVVEDSVDNAPCGVAEDETPNVGFTYHDYSSDVVDTDNVRDDSEDEEKVVTSSNNKGKQMHMSQTDKFYRKYPSMRPVSVTPSKESSDAENIASSNDENNAGHTERKTKKTANRKTKSDRTNRKWDVDTIKSFMSDVDKLPPTEAASKWGYDTVGKMYKAKYYLQSKLNKMGESE